MEHTLKRAPELRQPRHQYFVESIGRVNYCEASGPSLLDLVIFERGSFFGCCPLRFFATVPSKSAEHAKSTSRSVYTAVDSRDETLGSHDCHVWVWIRHFFRSAGDAVRRHVQLRTRDEKVHPFVRVHHQDRLAGLRVLGGSKRRMGNAGFKVPTTWIHPLRTLVRR